MRLLPFLLAPLLAWPLSGRQAAPPAPSAPSASPEQADIFYAPQDFRDFVVKATLPFHTWQSKTEGLARRMFAKPEDGGLGITYANDKTRTVAEVWRDRKANCISLTAFYAAACKFLGITVWFADAPSVTLWVRHGDLIYNERHVVAAIPVNALNTVVADFSPEVHLGAVHIRPITEPYFKSLFHSNRAVELLQEKRLDQALSEAESAIQEEPKGGVGWNTLGVVQQAMGHVPEAEQAYLKSLEVDPSSGIACGNLEQLYQISSRPQEAARYRELGLQLRDRDPYFHAFLAKEALDSGQLEVAESQIRKALRIQRTEPDFYLILAQAQLDLGDRSAAKASVEKAVHWSLPDQRKRVESKLALLQDQT